MHALRALVEVASIERHRGPVAGSGVLGLISAMLVQPKTPAPVRALAFQAVGVLVAYDEHEQDARRAEEFGKLRSQVLAVGGVEMMSRCLMPTRSQDGVALCASASACLVKICGDPGARWVAVMPPLAYTRNEAISSRPLTPARVPPRRRRRGPPRPPPRPHRARH